MQNCLPGCVVDARILQWLKRRLVKYLKVISSGGYKKLRKSSKLKRDEKKEKKKGGWIKVEKHHI